LAEGVPAPDRPWTNETALAMVASTGNARGQSQSLDRRTDATFTTGLAITFKWGCRRAMGQDDSRP
jgi:hypothetical protein